MLLWRYLLFYVEFFFSSGGQPILILKTSRQLISLLAGWRERLVHFTLPELKATTTTAGWDGREPATHRQSTFFANLALVQRFSVVCGSAQTSRKESPLEGYCLCWKKKKKNIRSTRETHCSLDFFPLSCSCLCLRMYPVGSPKQLFFFSFLLSCRLFFPPTVVFLFANEAR